MPEPKVLLVYPPNQLMDIETPRPDGSLGLLYLAGALRQIGIEADVVDMTVGTDEDMLEDTFHRRVIQENGLTRIGMSWKRIREFLGRMQYDIVALTSIFTPQTKMVFRVAEIAKEVNPQTLVISGGVNARNLSQRFFATGNFDLICNTEGEIIIKEIAKRFINNQGILGIPGTTYRDGSKFPLTSAMVVQDLDKLPFPAFDKLPFGKYERIASAHGVNLTGKPRRYAPLMTSRGCPFQCAYCFESMIRNVPGGFSPEIQRTREESTKYAGEIGNLRLKSVERVMQEVEILESHEVTDAFVEDDSFLAKFHRVVKILESLIAKGLTLKDVNGVNLVHLSKPDLGRPGKLIPNREYMELLYRAGFRQIVFPVESGSQRILKKYATDKLNHERMDVIELAKVAREIGILCPVNMMIGFPDETEAEMAQSIELAKRLVDPDLGGVPYVTFFIPIPFPGSALYEMAIRGGYLDPNFDPDTLNWKNCVMKNTTVPPEKIIEIRDRAWREVNPPEHIAQRLQDSIGAGRWTYNYDDEG